MSTPPPDPIAATPNPDPQAAATEANSTQTPTPTRVGVVGAAGRMGQRLLALTEAHPALAVAGAFDLDTPVSAAAAADCDVLIDFSTPEALDTTVAACRGGAAGLVLGTTGLSEHHQHLLREAEAEVPVLVASNFSVVVNVLHHLTRQAVEILGDGWDFEILEAHHRYKVDAPSGTALALAQTVAEAAGRDPKRAILTTRSGHDAARQPGDITVQTLRIGDHAGEHTVFMAAPGERLELRHVSTSRDSYASGAVRAAAWLAGRPPGRYAIADVLGIG